MTRKEAYQLMTEMIQSKNLQRHGLAVEAIMRELSLVMKNKYPDIDPLEFDIEEWGIVGLLHDADYELTDKDLNRHTLVMSERLGSLGVLERIIMGIQGHAPIIKPNRENYLEKAVFAVDELSGLITACALVQPEKKLSTVTIDSVMKKFKTSSFAAGAIRENIQACESELGIHLQEFVGIALAAMKNISDDLGL